jgi:hypothetical protein
VMLERLKHHVTKERYIKAFDPAVLQAVRKMQASLDERQAKGKQIVIPFDGNHPSLWLSESHDLLVAQRYHWIDG